MKKIMFLISAFVFITCSLFCDIDYCPEENESRTIDLEVDSITTQFKNELYISATKASYLYVVEIDNNSTATLKLDTCNRGCIINFDTYTKRPIIHYDSEIFHKENKNYIVISSINNINISNITTLISVVNILRNLKEDEYQIEWIIKE